MVSKTGKTRARPKKADEAGGLDSNNPPTADKILTIVQNDSITRSEKISTQTDKLRESGKSVDKVAQVVAEWTEDLTK